MCLLHIDVLLLFSQHSDWNVPVFWLVMASRKLEPHSKSWWQCRVFTCIALQDSQNHCCLLEVKKQDNLRTLSVWPFFPVFMCSSSRPLQFLKKFNVRGYGEALHGPMSALVTMWAAVVPSLKGKRAERAFFFY